MAEPNVQASDLGCIKEAVCIDAARIYDSCSDKDCWEDLQVFFTSSTQPVIDQAVTVKVRDVDVTNVFLDVESVPFNKGFYCVDMTFFLNVQMNAYTSPIAPPVAVDGLATFCKKVILYGSDRNVKRFESGASWTDPECSFPTGKPKATVQVAEPVILGCKLIEPCECRLPLESTISVPAPIASRYPGDFCCNPTPNKTVLITLGIFSIVQLERDVSLLVPTYEYCMPDKECETTTDDPCCLFKKIKFPTEEFFPPKLREDEDEENCGCD